MRDNMRVEVKDHLTASSIDVDEKSVPALRDPKLICDRGRHLAYVRKNHIVRRNIVKRGDVFPGNYQDVDRAHRVLVPKSYNELVFVHYVGRKLSPHDLAEDATMVLIVHCEPDGTGTLFSAGPAGAECVSADSPDSSEDTSSLLCF